MHTYIHTFIDTYSMYVRTCVHTYVHTYMHTQTVPAFVAFMFGTFTTSCMSLSLAYAERFKLVSDHALEAGTVFGASDHHRCVLRYRPLAGILQQNTGNRVSSTLTVGRRQFKIRAG